MPWHVLFGLWLAKGQECHMIFLIPCRKGLLVMRQELALTAWMQDAQQVRAVVPIHS